MVRFLDEKIIPILRDYAITYDPTLQKLTMSTEESNNGYKFTVEDKEKTIKELYTIIIDLTAECVKPHQSASDEEPVSDEEPPLAEEPSRISRSFKTDHCVICMENPPNVLFYKCMHICTCSNCKENTLNRCPYCRAIAIEKICI